MKQRLTGVFLLAGLVLTLDQASKAWVRSTLPLGRGEEIIPGFFNLVHVANRGAAFGFLNRSDISWQNTLFMAVSLFAVGLIAWLASKPGQGRTMFTAYGLVAGGALGNLVDRLRQGYVTDFLDFHYGGLHWPAFNLADAGITVGAVTLVLATFLQGRKEVGS
ncbi:signal peptidase II [Desulfohalovibrio reitneri]|uniref:signal peptidase II n=1 Tax=Desulfohalovibrio reitneri TaxID=1307759 RepID=UPI0004A74334|nr:signal peptidase II [Desulfohalovibrio reitneri]